MQTVMIFASVNHIPAHPQWCWWWQPIGKSPGWAWRAPRWCQSPLVCPLLTHTHTQHCQSKLHSVMSEQQWGIAAPLLALLESNELWNDPLIGSPHKHSVLYDATTHMFVCVYLIKWMGNTSAHFHELPLVHDILACGIPMIHRQTVCYDPDIWLCTLQRTDKTEASTLAVALWKIIRCLLMNWLTGSTLKAALMKCPPAVLSVSPHLQHKSLFSYE